MQVPLARPRLLSYDGLLLAVCVVVGTLGAAFLFMPPEPAARPAGAVLLVLGLLAVLPRRVLAMDVEGERLTVRTLAGRHRFELGSMGPAQVVHGHLLWKIVGAGLPGYHVGTYWLTGVGRVKAYCSRARGPFLLVRRPDAAPLLLSPVGVDAGLGPLGADGSTAGTLD